MPNPAQCGAEPNHVSVTSFINILSTNFIFLFHFISVLPPHGMNAPADLSDSLQQLHAQQQQQDVDDDVPGHYDPPAIQHSRDDYGFRRSGISTPMSGPNNSSPNRLDIVVPDPNGLGWPGK
jgi:hypothetical protein